METVSLLDVNFAQLARKCAFAKGVLVYENMYEPVDPKRPTAKPKY